MVSLENLALKVGYALGRWSLVRMCYLGIVVSVLQRNRISKFPPLPTLFLYVLCLLFFLKIYLDLPYYLFMYIFMWSSRQIGRGIVRQIDDRYPLSSSFFICESLNLSFSPLEPYVERFILRNQLMQSQRLTTAKFESGDSLLAKFSLLEEVSIFLKAFN